MRPVSPDFATRCLVTLSLFSDPWASSAFLGKAETAVRATVASCRTRLEKPEPLTTREVVELATALRSLQALCYAQDSTFHGVALRHATHALQPLAAELEELFPDEVTS